MQYLPSILEYCFGTWDGKTELTQIKQATQ